MHSSTSPHCTSSAGHPNTKNKKTKISLSKKKLLFVSIAVFCQEFCRFPGKGVNVYSELVLGATNAPLTKLESISKKDLWAKSGKLFGLGAQAALSIKHLIYFMGAFLNGQPTFVKCDYQK